MAKPAKQTAVIGQAYNPLDESDKQRLIECHAASVAFDQFYDKLKAIGLPIDDSKARNLELRNFFMLCLKHLFDHQVV